MFDRQMLSFYIKDKVEQLPLSQLNYGIANGFIKPDTLYFDNTIFTKNALENNWITEVRNTWLAGKYEFEDV
jgi:hypothetical protein